MVPVWGQAYRIQFLPFNTNQMAKYSPAKIEFCKPDPKAKPS
jgi:hypothetical protein